MPFLGKPRRLLLVAILTLALGAIADNASSHRLSSLAVRTATDIFGAAVGLVAPAARQARQPKLDPPVAALREIPPRVGATKLPDATYLPPPPAPAGTGHALIPPTAGSAHAAGTQGTTSNHASAGFSSAAAGISGPRLGLDAAFGTGSQGPLFRDLATSDPDALDPAYSAMNIDAAGGSLSISSAAHSNGGFTAPNEAALDLGDPETQRGPANAGPPLWLPSLGPPAGPPVVPPGTPLAELPPVVLFGPGPPGLQLFTPPPFTLTPPVTDEDPNLSGHVIANPEPGTLVLLGSGLIALLSRRRAKLRQA